MPNNFSNSPYLNKSNNCKPNKCFMLSLSVNSENIRVSLTRCSHKWKTNKCFFRNYHKRSPNLESTYVHKSLNTIERLSIIKRFTFDNLFLKGALNLSFKQSNVVPNLIPRAELMMVPPTFTANVPVVPSKEKSVFQGPYKNRPMFLIWGDILLLLDGIYLPFTA